MPENARRRFCHASGLHGASLRGLRDGDAMAHPHVLRGGRLDRRRVLPHDFLRGERGLCAVAGNRLRPDDRGGMHNRSPRERLHAQADAHNRRARAVLPAHHPAARGGVCCPRGKGTGVAEIGARGVGYERLWGALRHYGKGDAGG